MKKSEMVCRKCIKFEKGCCHLKPRKLFFGTIENHPDIVNYNPDVHWCAEGVWHEGSDRYKEMPFFWGEWE